MKARCAWCAVGSVAALLVLAVSCHSAAPKSPMEELRQFVSTSVTDVSRRESMLRELSAMTITLQQYDAAAKRAGHELRSLAGRYDARRGDFERIFRLAEAERLAARDRYMTHLLAMREQATDDEWESMFALEVKVHENRVILFTKPEAKG